MTRADSNLQSFDADMRTGDIEDSIGGANFVGFVLFEAAHLDKDGRLDVENRAMNGTNTNIAFCFSVPYSQFHQSRVDFVPSSGGRHRLHSSMRNNVCGRSAVPSLPATIWRVNSRDFSPATASRQCLERGGGHRCHSRRCAYSRLCGHVRGDRMLRLSQPPSSPTCRASGVGLRNRIGVGSPSWCSGGHPVVCR